MKYGHFDETRREYVTTPPDTWLHVATSPVERLLDYVKPSSPAACAALERVRQRIALITYNRLVKK